MALPKPSYPKYKLTLPSTGESVSYRPFTVREEKVLITALTGGEKQEIVGAIIDCIESCFDGVSVSNLTSFDVEYLFINLRSKSVSNIIEMEFKNYSCPNNNGGECSDTKKMLINIDEAKIQSKVDGVYVDFEPSKKTGQLIKLDDKLSVTMIYPSVTKLTEVESSEDRQTKLVTSCIKSVADDESVYTNFTEEEVIEWYDSLMGEQKDKILKFIAETPALRHTTDFKCNKCGYKEEIQLVGLHNFFA